MLEHDRSSDQPDLVAALAMTWPAFGRWQTRLADSNRVRAVRERVRSAAFQRTIRLGIIIVFIAFISLAIYRNWDELQNYEWQADMRYALAVVAAFPLSYLPTAWCWHWIIRRISRFPNGRANAYIFFLSSLGRNVPGAIWHIAGRAYWYRDYQVPTSHVIIGAAWENLVLITSGLIVYTLLGWQQVAVAGLAIAAAVFLYPIFLNRLVTLAYQKLEQPPPQPVAFLDVLILLTVLVIAWSAGGFLLWLTTNAVYPLGPEALPSLIAFWGLAGTAGILSAFLVGGLGIRELTLGVLLSQVMPAPIAIIVALAFRLVITISEALWAISLCWLTRSRKRIIQKG